jgi:hypothetical protein
MNYDTAKQVETILQHVHERLNDSIKVVMNSSDPDEFHRYRRQIGKIMGEIFLEIQQPLYAEHPDLTPPGLCPQ